MKLLPETFLREFVLPLVTGGELHVGRPIDAEDLSRLEAELVTPTEESVTIERARADRAAALWLYPVATQVDLPSLQLTAALHNLLFLSHPGAQRWWLRQSSVDRLEAFTVACLEHCPAPTGGAELVSRHTLLGNISELTRTDVEIRFWAGRRIFKGQQPPKRLTRWKGMRGVREHRQRITWIDTALSPSQQDVLVRLLRHSPLTDLLTPERSFPVFEWAPLAHHLTDAQLCRLVCHSYLRRGLEVVGPTLAQAFWRLVERTDQTAMVPEGGQLVLPPPSSPWVLQLVGSLVVYLYAITALTTADEDVQPAFDPQDPMGSLLVVLMAAVRCGLMPDPKRMGGNSIHERLQKWAGEIATGPLGSTGDDLTQRLKAALAA